MFDDFLFRALIAGIGIALVTGPLGCFVVWRRLSFFGDTLAHSALLGVLLSVAFDLNISLTIFTVSSLIALLLLRLQKTTNLPSDALLGLLSHSSLAVGLVILGFLSFIQFDIMGVLFGDILSVNVNDLLAIWIGGAIIAEAEGMNPERVNAIFTILLAALIAISIKMVGLLLITGMLIIPTTMARNLSNNPKQMVILSIIGGLLSVFIGLYTSFEINTSSGPTIVVVALILFILSLIGIKKRNYG